MKHHTYSFVKSIFKEDVCRYVPTTFSTCTSFAISAATKNERKKKHRKKTDLWCLTYKFKLFSKAVLNIQS